LLRRFAPAGLVDAGLRKDLQLDAMQTGAALHEGLYCRSLWEKPALRWQTCRMPELREDEVLVQVHAARQ
jgi:hypothetical protein